jgi:hypothetical protein
LAERLGRLPPRVDSITAVSINCRVVEHLLAFGFGDR